MDDKVIIFIDCRKIFLINRTLINHKNINNNNNNYKLK